MRSQTAIASKRNIRYQPYAFTEHAVAMLSAALKSDRAVPLFNFANCWSPTKTWFVPSSNMPRCCNLCPLPGHVEVGDFAWTAAAAGGGRHCARAGGDLSAVDR